MKIYVAGKTHDFERVRRVQAACQRLGHTITFDWTETVEAYENPGDGHDFDALTPEFKAECGENDFMGVASAELVIALVEHEHITGTLIEIGMALALYKDVWLVGKPKRDSVFYYLPQVKQKFSSVYDIIHHLPFHLEDNSTSGVGFPD
jgi:nucleoside 2-deoxyribosyltransferase